MKQLAILGGKPVRESPYSFEHDWGQDAREALDRVLDSRATSVFYGGPVAREFERVFASIHGRQHAVSCNSGTSALHVAYQAAGLGAGDEVIIPANAYISAFSAALQLNAVPRLCDIGNDNCIDPEHASSLVGPRTRLVVPVHLYGYAADVPQLSALVRSEGVQVVEDCGQGHGALLNDGLAGSLGDISCFSFFTCKHVTTGEGGMCLTDNRDVAEMIRALCHKGKGTGWYDYRTIGYSYTMTDIQAALGLATLANFSSEVDRRRRYAETYSRAIGEIGLEVIREPAGVRSSFFKYPFRLPSEYGLLSEWFEKACRAENVVVARGYPHLATIGWIHRKEYSAWHLTEAGKHAVYVPEDTPRALDIASRTLTACTGPGVTETEVTQTIEAIAKVTRYMMEHRSHLMSAQGLS